MSGKLLTPLRWPRATRCRPSSASTKRAAGCFYTARDGDNFMKLQLHSVGLDGKGDKRLTNPSFNHTVTMSPDGKFFVDVAQTHDMAPSTRLCAADGSVVADVAASNMSTFDQVGLKRVEMSLPGG